MNAWLKRNGLSTNRQRFTRVLLFGGLLAVFLYIAPYVPRDTRIMLDLGERHAEVVELALTYSLGPDDLRSTTLTYPAGAPRRVMHDVRLPSGDIALATRQLLRDGRMLEDTRRFTTPSEADVRISLNKE